MLSAEESCAPKQQCQVLVECKIRHAAWENKGLGLLKCTPVPPGLLLYHSGRAKHSVFNVTACTRQVIPLQQAAWTAFRSLAHLLHGSAQMHLNFQLTLKCKPLTAHNTTLSNL